jgi:hypothetical protein
MKQLNTVFLIMLVLIIFCSMAFADEFFVNATRGSDFNTGLTRDTAWKTLKYPLAIVEGTAEKPVTINIAAGTYSILQGETFPIKLKNYVTLKGTGYDSTIIDASGGDSSVMNIDDVVGVNIEGLTITGGNNIDDYGGGFKVENSQAIIKNCMIKDNYGFLGGGVACLAPATEFVDCIITNNRAYIGAGVWIYGITLKNCIIENNTTDLVYYGQGGGIYIYPHDVGISIIDCNIRNNVAIDGAGIFCENAQTHIKGCIVENNKASARGGGIAYTEYALGSLSNCTISNNSALQGAGIYCEKSSPMISDCVIEGNSGAKNDDSTYSYGGGIYILDESSPDISKCKFKNNTADYGAGISCGSNCYPDFSHCIIEGNKADRIGCAIYCQPDEDFSTLFMINCLIYNNSTDNITTVACYGNSQSRFKNCTLSGNDNKNSWTIYSSSDSRAYFENSIIWGNSESPIYGKATISFSDIEGGYDGNGNINQDPLFVTGPRGDFYLSQIASGQDADSPCIDTSSILTTIDYEWLTNRTDGIFDKNLPDMGYHYEPHIQFVLSKSPNYYRVSTGNELQILLGIKTAPKNTTADVYLVMLDPQNQIWSGLQCTKGVTPLLRSFTFPANLSLKDIQLWSIKIPSDVPPITSTGKYTFCMMAVIPGTFEPISNQSIFELDVQ